MKLPMNTQVTYVPRCAGCGQFTDQPEVCRPHPVPGCDVEYRYCLKCQAVLLSTPTSEATDSVDDHG